MENANYKHENAILALKKDYSYEYDNSGDTDFTKKIHQLLIDIDFNYQVCKSCDFYFETPIPSKSIRGYKNTKISHVNISCDNEVVFHIIFDVENPQIEEINKLKAEEKKYDNLSDVEFNKVKKEHYALLSKISELDQYISNFSYAYSQSVDADVIEAVYNEMIKPANILKSKYISELITKKRYTVKDNMSYQEKLEYWDLLDELKDLTEYNTPDEAEIEKRNKRRLKSEEDYIKEQQRIMKLIGL